MNVVHAAPPSCKQSMFRHHLLFYVALLTKSSTADINLDGGTGGWAESQWYVQVDGVMGGRSSGQLKFENGRMLFSGGINLVGGGFSSVRRSMTEQDLSSFAGIVVEVETKAFSRDVAPLGLHLQLGDSSSRFDFAAAFAIPFSNTAGDSASVFLPLYSFDRASRGGRTCSSCALDARRVNEIDVYVLFQEGPFDVAIRSITAVTKAAVFSAPSVQMTSSDINSFIAASIRSGASLYSKGYVELCIAIYTSALKTILASSDIGGVKGVACFGLKGATSGTKEEKAWALRDAMDAIVADIAGTARGSRQSWLPNSTDAASSLDECRDYMQTNTNSIPQQSPPEPSSGSSSQSVASFKIWFLPCLCLLMLPWLDFA